MAFLLNFRAFSFPSFHGDDGPDCAHQQRRLCWNKKHTKLKHSSQTDNFLIKYIISQILPFLTYYQNYFQHCLNIQIVTKQPQMYSGYIKSRDVLMIFANVIYPNYQTAPQSANLKYLVGDCKIASIHNSINHYYRSLSLRVSSRSKQ